MSKINILVVYNDNSGGVGFYRSKQPHDKLLDLYNEDYNIVFTTTPNWLNLDEFSLYDIIHIHNGIYANDSDFIKALKFFKEKNIKVVIDLDDHWKMESSRDSYFFNKINQIPERIVRNIKLADYVTTTTELFAEEIRVHNKNVIVLPNAIDPTDDRFKVEKTYSDKLRVGFVMGSSHRKDVEIMNGFIQKMDKNLRDKVEFVLCGFDINCYVRTINEKGMVHTEMIHPSKSVWGFYEKLITNDYKDVSKHYREFLLKYVPNLEYPYHEEEGYRRCWTKSIDEYYQHYRNIDVLLAPLNVSPFNKVKSQLKVIEAAFSKTAIIASNFGPYTIDLKNLFEKGGSINENGNAILIDETKNHKDWSKAIEKLVKNPDLVDKLKNNLYNDITPKYSLNEVTKYRDKFYKEICQKTR